MIGFAYAVEGDSTADADMVRLLLEPDTMPVYMPYGQEFRGADGQPIYAGAPTLTLRWSAMTFDTDIDGTPVSTGTIKQFYTDWRRARDDHGQRFVVNLFNPTTNTWAKFKCVILWPDWSGKELGPAFIGFEITIVAIGVDFDVAPAWGEPNAPAFSEDPETMGDGLVGAIGYGVIGRGVIGHGSMI